MKVLFIFLSLAFLSGSNAFSRTRSQLPREVLDAIPNQYDLNNSKYADAKRELESLVKDCGPGVVRNARSRTSRPLANHCDFQVELDKLFFTATREKTGLIQDKNFAYATGVTFYEPPVVEVPDTFDLRDLMLNGQPEIKQQNCGDCWAWSTHHGLEIARAVHDQKVFDLSVQTVLSCSKAGSCGGGSMGAVDFLLHGLPDETDFPYAGSNKRCKYTSSQIQTGWDGKIIADPYIGNSLQYSLAKRTAEGTFREGTKVKEMMAALYEWKSPLVVTVKAYSISGDGVYNSCSSINSGGDHMVAIVGWDSGGGTRNAHVWNSWGKSHGKDGVSRIKWECGDRKLNRGLGVSAKIVQYKAPCTPPNAAQIYMHETLVGNAVEIGADQPSGTACSWVPTDGLDNPNACLTKAKPSQTTEYHLTAKNDCGTSSSMTLVHLWGRVAQGQKETVRTPFGDVEIQK